VRDLIAELALLPVEGGARVAIIEAAHRLNEDAQAALLKTLEEPPAGATIVLCADAEEPLLPTIRSRCARIRLGPVGVRDIETILADAGAADPPVAARLARIAGGRPGIALAWAAAPDAIRDRDAIGRGLLDLAPARAADRLSGIRSLASQATAIAGLADGTAASPGGDDATTGRRKRGASAASPETMDIAPTAADADDTEAAGPARTPAVERRRAAEAIISLWTDVARDIALCQRGLDRSVRDLALLDDVRALAVSLEPGAVGAFIDRLGRASVLIAGNASPELVLDDLALAWPRPRAGSRAA
jgi:DNA polymerase-3 subunit delta'